jgi:Ohr subfamily peroxiredoxin
MKTLYTAHATTIAGRNGHSKTDDGTLDLDLSVPGSGKPGTNPEQLFACGYSACFGSAIDAVAKKEKAPVSEIKVQADVSLHQDEASGYSISAVLNVTLSGVDEATAKKLVAAAHQICPYSKATRGNIDVKLQVSGSELKAAA